MCVPVLSDLLGVVNLMRVAVLLSNLLGPGVRWGGRRGKGGEAEGGRGGWLMGSAWVDAGLEAGCLHFIF